MLANEQVIDGKGWRSGATVERKKLNQWFFNIKKFSEELLENLNSLDEWSKKVKVMQKNWIGKSFGCEVSFKIENSKNISEIKYKVATMFIESIYFFFPFLYIASILIVTRNPPKIFIAAKNTAKAPVYNAS